MNTMNHPLAGVWAKIERAEKHISDFREMGKAFNQSNPILLAHIVDTTNWKDILYFKEVKATPIEFSLIIGDAIHNLRSALDLLACQLVRLRNIKHDCAGISFPIADDVHKFKKILQRVEFWGQSAVQLVEALEPYKGGKDHELWQLHRLNIQDKHRLLLVTPVAVGPMLVEIAPVGINNPPREVLARNQMVIPKQGEVILAIGSSLHKLSPQGQVNVTGKFNTDIAIDEPEIIQCQPVYHTLDNFVTVVKGVVKQFEPFFAGNDQAEV